MKIRLDNITSCMTYLSLCVQCSSQITIFNIYNDIFQTIHITNAAVDVSNHYVEVWHVFFTLIVAGHYILLYLLRSCEMEYPFYVGTSYRVTE